jgi:hypothetical protein
MAKLTAPKISKRIGFDSMSISGKFPSGASLKFSIGRSGEKMELSFSNDINVLKAQMKTFKSWMDYRPNETNLDRFDRLEKILQGCQSGAQVISKMEADLASR